MLLHCLSSWVARGIPCLDHILYIPILDIHHILILHQHNTIKVDRGLCMLPYVCCPAQRCTCDALPCEGSQPDCERTPAASADVAYPVLLCWHRWQVGKDQRPKSARLANLVVLEPRPRPKGHNAPKVPPRSERESGGPGTRDHCWACRQGSFNQALVEQRRTEILPTKTVGQRGPLAPEPEGVPLGSDWACWLAACLAGIGRCALFITLLCLPSSLPGPGRPQTERTIHGGCELPDASALP